MEFSRCLRCMQPLEGYPCPSCGFDPAKDASLDYGLRPGSILNGKYVIGTVLGQGGFGITYAGWDLALDCKVAVKEYYPSGQVVRDGAVSNQLRWFNTAQSEAAQNTGKEMFLKEARKMTRVRNISQVVHVHDLFQENDTAYIVMDFVEGQTLKAYLSQHGMLSWEEAKAIFFPAIRAMEQVHQTGLVHRDLSPDNLMLTETGDVQILDLGAAKDLNVNSGASSMQVAKTGFSPLEQYSQRGGSGPWTDVYAMAATMYYSITGVLPPPVMDRMEEDLLRWDLEPLQAIPASAREALNKALTIFPKSRTQSMAEFLKGLEAPAPAPKPEPPSPPPPKVGKIVKAPAPEPEKKKSPIYAIVAAVLVVALLAGWALWPKNAEEPQMESVVPAETVKQIEVYTQPETAPISDIETISETEPCIYASEITLWTYPIGGWGNQETVESLMADFETATGIKVTVEYLTYADGDDKVSVAIEANDTPDLIMAEPERLVANWGTTGRMVNIADLFDDTDKSELNAAALAACFADDSTAYEYPLTMTAHCMAINKTVFEAAGAMQYINEETHTWNSVEDFFNAMNAVYEYTGKQVGAVYCVGRGGDQGTRALVNNLNGGTFTNAEHTEYTWGSEENIAALKALYDTETIAYDAGINGGDEINLFYNGTLNVAFCWNIAQQLNPNANNTGAEKTANGDDIMFMAFPADGDAKLQGGIWGFGIFDNGDDTRIASAKAFIRYFCDSEATADAVKVANYFAVRDTAEGADLSTIWADNAIMAEYNVLMPLLGDYYQVTNGWAEARTCWWKMLQQVSASDGSVEAITEAVNTYVAQANGQ